MHLNPNKSVGTTLVKLEHTPPFKQLLEWFNEAKAKGLGEEHGDVSWKLDNEREQTSNEADEQQQSSSVPPDERSTWSAMRAAERH